MATQPCPSWGKAQPRLETGIHRGVKPRIWADFGTGIDVVNGFRMRPLHLLRYLMDGIPRTSRRERLETAAATITFKGHPADKGGIAVTVEQGGLLIGEQDGRRVVLGACLACHRQREG